MKLAATIHRTFGPESKVRAIATIVIDDSFAIHGVKVIDSSKGTFVAMPNTKYKDEYQDVCHPIDLKTRELVFDTVITAYEKELGIKREYAMTEDQIQSGSQSEPECQSQFEPEAGSQSMSM